MKRIFFFAAAAVMLMVLPSNGFAARDGNLFLGAYYLQTSFHGGDIKGLDDENGAGVRIGMETPKHIFAYELSYFETKHDTGLNDESLSGLTFNLRLSFPFSDLIAPYGFAGWGQYALHMPDAIVFRGEDNLNGFQVGGGLALYLSQYFSLNVGYTKRRMQFDYGPTSNKIELHTKAITYDAGATVHFE